MDDRFQIGTLLGAGGMGLVHEAYDHARHELVALKTLRRADPVDIDRFKREFRALADLSHPNLVTLHELFCVDGDWFFTMERVDGVDFVSHVRGSDPGDRDTDASLPTVPIARWAGPAVAAATPRAIAHDAEQLRAALRQLADGLVALHDAGKLHRDLKPSNVLVTPAGRVVMLDFGLVAELARRPTPSLDEPLTGTPGYMAPEQIAGAPATAASDWYAVGVILFEALVGRLPFEGPAVQVMCEKQVRDAPRLAGRPGVPPDLAALCDGLLARDPAARLDGAAVVARLGGAPVEVTGVHGLARPLFGRDDALGALRDAYLDTRAGAAVTVVIRGASGVGKTALVRHFLSELPPDAIALDGRCYECESVPFKGLDEVVDRLADALAGLRDPRAFFPGDLVPLIRVFPALARIAGIALDDPDGEVAAVGDLRARAFAGFRELIGRLAASRPVVIAIDDAQWGDADGAALLAELVAPPDAPPALVILSCRSDDREPGPLVRALRSNRELALAPLPVSDARALARHVLDAGADPALVERIARASSGSPLLLCELARHLRHGDGAPRDLAAMVLDRVGGLAADARALLEVIAIAGRPVRERIARDAAGVDAAAGGAALASLRAARLVRVRRSGVECHHDHIRAAVVGALEPGRRRARHLRLATTLQALPGADPEALVEHFRAGGEPARAGHHAIRAAERAVRALAFDRAAVYYTLAAELGAASPEIWERLGDARMVLGEHLAAGLAYEQAQAAPPATRDQIRRLRKLATVAQKSGRYGDALALCRRALDLATDPGDLAAASVEALAALTCCYAGDLADGMRWADRAAARLERSLERGAERHVVDAALCRARGNLLLALGQPREAAEVYRRGLAACEALDDRWERSIALFNLGEALAEAGDLEGAMRYLETARAEKSSLGDRWGLGYTWLILARVHAALGDLPRALECARAGATFSAEVGDPKLSSLMHETLSRLMPPAPPPRRRAAHPT